ncbi:uncharacterized protein LOC141912184 [Tubulanus polymorphus]|uniref:uncharacterized protein LOC141912184 n=1 Tax=Tubulanus polymorphus TaxID=672921 RepID=UPI003DA35DC6
MAAMSLTVAFLMMTVLYSSALDTYEGITEANMNTCGNTCSDSDIQTDLHENSQKNRDCRSLCHQILLFSENEIVVKAVCNYSLNKCSVSLELCNNCPRENCRVTDFRKNTTNCNDEMHDDA